MMDLHENGRIAPSNIRTFIFFLPRQLLSLFIRAYQKIISPLFPAQCRYGPTCSEYTLQAVLKYGVLKGSWLGLRRIAKCHPWQPGGYDPVP